MPFFSLNSARNELITVCPADVVESPGGTARIRESFTPAELADLLRVTEQRILD
jgi:hypothetical protein